MITKGQLKEIRHQYRKSGIIKVVTGILMMIMGTIGLLLSGLFINSVFINLNKALGCLIIILIITVSMGLLFGGYAIGLSGSVELEEGGK